MNLTEEQVQQLREDQKQLLRSRGIYAGDGIPVDRRRLDVMYGLYHDAPNSRGKYFAAAGSFGKLEKRVEELLSYAPFFDHTWIMEYTPQGEMRPLWYWSAVNNVWVEYKA